MGRSSTSAWSSFVVIVDGTLVEKDPADSLMSSTTLSDTASPRWLPHPDGRVPVELVSLDGEVLAMLDVDVSEDRPVIVAIIPELWGSGWRRDARVWSYTFGDSGSPPEAAWHRKR